MKIELKGRRDKQKSWSQGKEVRSFMAQRNHCIGVIVVPVTYARPLFPASRSTAQNELEDRPQEISRIIENRDQRAIKNCRDTNTL